MAIKGINVVTVPVNDQESAIEFYTTKLGFTKTADMPLGEKMRWVQVLPPGGGASITLAKDYGTGEATHPGQFTGIVFNTDDIQATYEELKAKGVTFTEAPERQPWGMWQAQFVDQDGNGFVLVSNG